MSRGACLVRLLHLAFVHRQEVYSRRSQIDCWCTIRCSQQFTPAGKLRDEHSAPLHTHSPQNAVNPTGYTGAAAPQRSAPLWLTAEGSPHHAANFTISVAGRCALIGNHWKSPDDTVRCREHAKVATDEQTVPRGTTRCYALRGQALPALNQTMDCQTAEPQQQDGVSRAALPRQYGHQQPRRFRQRPDVVHCAVASSRICASWARQTAMPDRRDPWRPHTLPNMPN
jgi:hypothetical protein